VIQAGFAVDSNTGAITKLAGGATNLIEPPIDLVSANEQGGTFVFVLTATGPDENLASFKVDPGSGSLTPVQNISFSNDTQQWLAVHPSGKFLYTQQAANNNFCLLAYLIDPVTGNLKESSCSSLGGGDSFVIAPSGNFGWSSDGVLGRLYSYVVSQTDGSLSLRFNSSFMYATTLVAIDPFGRALYALFRDPNNQSCGGLALWSIDPNSGYLTTALDSNSMNPQCEPRSITFTPADTFAYVIAEPSDQSPVNGLFVGSVDPNTGNLINVPGSPVTPTPLLLQAEPSQGNYLIGVVGPTPYSVTSFAIGSTTGLPTRLSAIAVPLTEQAPVKMIVVAPN
jgi:6-phosphogluconolactonase (cycloisomerase 2 family)